MTEAEFYSLLDNIQSGECEISATELYEELDAFLTIEARRRELVERYAASTSPLIFDTISLWLRRRLWTADEAAACELASRCVQLCREGQSYESVNHLVALVLSSDLSMSDAPVLRKLALMCSAVCASKGPPSCELLVDVMERIVELHPNVDPFDPVERLSIFECLQRCHSLATSEGSEYLSAGRIKALIERTARWYSDR